MPGAPSSFLFLRPGATRVLSTHSGKEAATNCNEDNDHYECKSACYNIYTVHLSDLAAAINQPPIPMNAWIDRAAFPAGEMELEVRSKKGNQNDLSSDSTFLWLGPIKLLPIFPVVSWKPSISEPHPACSDVSSCVSGKTFVVHEYTFYPKTSCHSVRLAGTKSGLQPTSDGLL